MSFDIQLILQSIPQIMQGIGLTLQLLFFSVVLGFVLAVLAALMRISRVWFLVWPSFLYTYVFRGTPMLVQLRDNLYQLQTGPTLMRHRPTPGHRSRTRHRRADRCRRVLRPWFWHRTRNRRDLARFGHGRQAAPVH